MNIQLSVQATFEVLNVSSTEALNVSYYSSCLGLHEKLGS